MIKIRSSKPSLKKIESIKNNFFELYIYSTNLNLFIPIGYCFGCYFIPDLLLDAISYFTKVHTIFYLIFIRKVTLT
jgi:hypothetical protein